MKVLFLQPNYDAHVIHPPLGLGYLAAYLRQEGNKVALFDGTLHRAGLKDYLQAVNEFNPQLIGISVLTRGHIQAKEIINAIKGKYKEVPIVIGGTQVTAAPKEVMADLKADFAILGEGEITLSELTKALEISQKNFCSIKSLAYKVKGGVRINEPRELVADLDQLPFPAWDLMPPANYRIAPILEPARAQPIAPIMTSRGCPYNCSFCASNVTWRRKIRFRSPQNIVKEIKMLKNNFGVKEIHFSDDNFTMDIARAEKICDLLIKEKVNLPWQCPNGVRLDRLTPGLIRKMKKSGCYAVGLGIESGNPDVLKKVNKNLDLKITSGVLRELKKAGIESYGFFILGLPQDTKKTIQQTIDFALKNHFDRAWFNIFTPYPGSPAFPSWLGKKKFCKIDWEKHDCSTAVVKGADFSPSELEKIQKIALFKFYSRPRVFLKLISKIRYHELVTLLMSRFLSNIFTPARIAHRFAGRKV